MAGEAAVSETPATARSQSRTDAPHRPDVREALRRIGGPPPEAEKHAWTGRRITILGIVAAAVIVIIVVGGFAVHSILSPGYKPGRYVVMGSVRVTVTSVECGLTAPPFGDSGTPDGTYCGVVVSVRNDAKITDRSASFSLRDWRADLDVDLDVAPVADFLPAYREHIDPGKHASYGLTYDIPDGSRLADVTVVLDDKHGKIPVS